MKLAAKTTDELQKIHQEALEQYEDFKSLHLQLNMARGKPCAEQLDLALGVLEALHARSEFANSNGDDCRNYGVWNGLPEMRAIFSEMMDVPADQIILGNNSSPADDVRLHRPGLHPRLQRLHPVGPPGEGQVPVPPPRATTATSP